MKKLLFWGSLAVIGASLTSCDDFLDDNRDPMSQQTVNSTFWSNPVNVENQLNYFYETFVGYGNGTALGNFYFTTMSDDQSGQYGGTFRNWKYTSVPTSSTSWNSPYTEIRRANLVIEGVSGSTMTEADQKGYLAIARLFRAYNYYLLVRAYGDVPLIKGVVDVDNSDALYGPRTARAEVMDYALEDLNYAVENIPTQSSKTQFSKDLANAMKAEICLFEGTYSIYVAKNNERGKKYLNEVVNSCNAIMAGGYSIGDYALLYNSHNGALTSHPEVILAKCYQQGVFMHSTVDWTSGSTPIAGISKDAFDSFLFIDGKPKATTSENTDDAGVIDATGKLSIAAQLAVRDKRLAATIYDHIMYQDCPYQVGNTSNMTSTSGYGIKKYNDNVTHSLSDATTANKNYNDAPIYWLAEIYLAYAEAKAELGTLTDDDLDKTINKLYTRAGLPTQTVAGLNAINDPANNMGVSSLIWEIRRCRRCELMLDNDIRYWDLIRWGKLELCDTKKYPNVVLGANLKNATVDFAKTAEGYMDPRSELYGGLDRVYDKKYDLYPIPSEERALNPNLTPNPGWE